MKIADILGRPLNYFYDHLTAVMCCAVGAKSENK
jgi:hypothetical protein